ncbi:MAG: hypothetical protein GWN07_37800, partial [Actinobacteria bacterium]|nr:hypothetical protein [Actinomycetota bacterium]NIX25250.1 hypothetical protein [Actinomycetota bacterium]
LDQNGAGGGADPAVYELSLADDADNRHLFDEADAATAVTLTGAADATLPIKFPSSIPEPENPDIVLSIGDLGDV